MSTYVTLMAIVLNFLLLDDFVSLLCIHLCFDYQFCSDITMLWLSKGSKKMDVQWRHELFCYFSYSKTKIYIFFCTMYIIMMVMDFLCFFCRLDQVGTQQGLDSNYWSLNYRYKNQNKKITKIPLYQYNSKR